ncbi:MAG: hypothetical protein HYY26_06855 [Acidobacteria bacterium]|nr:hypothetical protein [Acidobacteriota bacterium]
MGKRTTRKAASEPRLYPYQERWVEDEARFKIACKARQIGFTFAAAWRVVDKRLREPGLTLWISASERQALEAMEHVRRFCRELRVAALSEGEFVEGTQVKQHTVRLGNGSRIVALPANPDTVRGFAGDVVLDEFAFHRDAEAIWRAAFATATRGFQIEIISTPNGTRGKYYELAKAAGLVDWEEQQIPRRQGGQGLGMTNSEEEEEEEEEVRGISPQRRGGRRGSAEREADPSTPPRPVGGGTALPSATLRASRVTLKCQEAENGSAEEPGQAGMPAPLQPFPSESSAQRLPPLGSGGPGGGGHRAEQEGLDSVWSAHWVDLSSARRQGFVVDVESLRAALADEDAWQQEYCCRFLSQAAHYIPPELVVAAEHPGGTNLLPPSRSHSPAAL